MTERSDDLQRSRHEAALLLRLDPQNLSPSDALKCDLISTLRLSIDSAQADALDGHAADLGRLIVATETLVKLLPTAPPKPVDVDNHEAIAPLLKLFRYLHEQVHTLTAENAQLRAQLGLPGALATKNAIDPPISDICPPNEQAACDRGARPGPDDPKPPVTIEAKANPPAAPQSWDDTPHGVAWREWNDAGGGSARYDRWANRGG
jgi:hypothetical protein